MADTERERYQSYKMVMPVALYPVDPGRMKDCPALACLYRGTALWTGNMQGPSAARTLATSPVSAEGPKWP